MTKELVAPASPHVRRIAVEVAWAWVRWQPDSALTRWYRQRFGAGGGRLRRIGIVALARKLLIALWRYSEHGIVPDGRGDADLATVATRTGLRVDGCSSRGWGGVPPEAEEGTP